MSQLAVDVTAYLHTYDQIEQEIDGLSEEQLKWKAAPESWSITEVLTHLVDHSIVVSFRVREILSGSEARLPAFSQDEWVSGQKANEGDVRDILSAAKAFVQYNSLLFNRLTAEEWSKTGVNFKGVDVALSAIVPAFIVHVQGHLEQIRRIKQGELDSRSANSTK